MVINHTCDNIEKPYTAKKLAEINDSKSKIQDSSCYVIYIHTYYIYTQFVRRKNRL